MEETKNTHYPSYDVMNLQDEWDSHTKEIVSKRLQLPNKLSCLSVKEQQILQVIASHLVYEERSEILEWIVSHIDQRLAEQVGEAQRKPGALPEKKMVKEGLKAINGVSLARHGSDFLKISTAQQCALLSDLQSNQGDPVPSWSRISQKDLFKKLLGLIVSPYYSHPTVWSEIGYGGPAYPRGYVRIELGLTDDWEPREEGEH